MKRRCPYCKKTGIHHLSCPETEPSNLAKQKKWNDGWEDGRSGKEPSSKDADYLFAYKMGERALEEAENGFDGRW